MAEHGTGAAMLREEALVFTDDVATFGDRLTHAREAAGLSVAGLARRLGVRRPLVEAWEEDQREPRANQLQMMSGMLGVSLRWLLTGEGGAEEAPPVGGPLPEEARRVMGELAQMRVEMLALVGRMGELESRLRADLGAGRT
ncbi:helix-turn-helix domain-containing protein [Paragemmobacter kunshanensis]|nr:helix-turn-helix domain-containing protein [Rhodobacter kunshanensis]